jgi:hypothetical protein
MTPARERSIPAVIITKVTPIPRMASMDACLRMLTKLEREKKFLFKTVSSREINSRMKNLTFFG